MEVFTVGHSSREMQELLDLLEAHRIQALCDVRAFPRSRRSPHFGRDELSAALENAGIAYHWQGEELGGYRDALKHNSPHSALQPGSWRNYADHMETEEFQSGIAHLLDVARAGRTACLCAERHWVECHRRHIADYLVAIEDVEVTHIVDPDEARPHRVDSRARVVGRGLIYDVGSQGKLF